MLHSKLYIRLLFVCDNVFMQTWKPRLVQVEQADLELSEIHKEKKIQRDTVIFQFELYFLNIDRLACKNIRRHNNKNCILSL